MIELSNSKKTFLGKVGKRNRYALDCHIGAVQMKEDGVWYDIDPTLENGLPKRVPYIVTPYLTGMPGFHYKSKQSGEFDVRLRSAKSLSLSGSPTLVAKIPVPIIEGKRIIWRDVYPDTDVVLLHMNTGVTLQRIIKSKKSPLEYDVDIGILEEGIAQVLPLAPASDAIGQSLLMEEVKTARGRTERLKLEVVSGESQLITYPIMDGTVAVEIAGGLDDDMVYRSNSYWVSNSANGRVGYASSTYNMGGCGFRFTSVGIPAGNTVTVAYLTVIANASESNNTVNSDLCCENSNNPNRIYNYAEHIGRTRTTGAACIAWDGVESFTDGNPYQSPSIVAAVQKVVDDQSGTGDALIVFWEDKDDESTHSSNTRRSPSMYDQSSGAEAPALYIEYSEGAPGWSNIASLRQGTGEVASADIANIRMGTGSIAVADIAKIHGVVV